MFLGELGSIYFAALLFLLSLMQSNLRDARDLYPSYRHQYIDHEYSQHLDCSYPYLKLEDYLSKICSSRFSEVDKIYVIQG